MANKIIIPAAEALKFPDLEVTQSGGVTFKLPPVSCKTSSPDSETSSVPKASLVCLSFRASSQAMIDSWSLPFYSSFSDAKNIHLYEEVAIAYGYINIQMPMPKLHQPVKPLPLNEFSDLLSDEITQMGQKKNDELKSVAKARGES